MPLCALHPALSPHMVYIYEPENLSPTHTPSPQPKLPSTRNARAQEASARACSCIHRDGACCMGCVACCMVCVACCMLRRPLQPQNRDNVESLRQQRASHEHKVRRCVRRGMALRRTVVVYAIGIPSARYVAADARHTRAHDRTHSRPHAHTWPHPRARAHTHTISAAIPADLHSRTHTAQRVHARL